MKLQEGNSDSFLFWVNCFFKKSSVPAASALFLFTLKTQRAQRGWGCDWGRRWRGRSAKPSHPNESEGGFECVFEHFPVNIHTTYSTWWSDVLRPSEKHLKMHSLCNAIFTSVLCLHLYKGCFQSQESLFTDVWGRQSLQTSPLARIHNRRQFSETRGRCWCQKEGKGGIRSGEGEKGRFVVRARLEQLEWKWCV